MRRAWWMVITAMVWVAQVGGRAQTPERMLGFDVQGSSAQRDFESRFDAAIQPAHVKEWLEHLAARPHHVGSPYDKANAEYLADLFKSWGYDTRIERFDVLFPTPRVRVLELTAPASFTATLAEPALADDPTSVADRRAVADLQRVLGGGRRHGAARLRELRHARTTTRSSRATAST